MAPAAATGQIAARYCPRSIVRPRRFYDASAEDHSGGGGARHVKIDPVETEKHDDRCEGCSLVTLDEGTTTNGSTTIEAAAQRRQGPRSGETACHVHLRRSLAAFTSGSFRTGPCHWAAFGR